MSTYKLSSTPLEITSQNYNLLSPYSDETTKWINGLKNTADLAYNKSPLTYDSNRHFDRSTLFGFTNREMILEVLRKVHLVPEIDSSFIRLITNPPIYRFGTEDFKMNVHDYLISKSSITYISNFDAFNIITEGTKIIGLLTKDQYQDLMYNRYFGTVKYRGVGYSGDGLKQLLYEGSLFKSFCERYTSSRRLLPIYKLIQLVFESSEFDEVRGFSWELNPVLSAISQLYAKYSDFPFREVNSDLKFTQSCSMILPEITFALCELWFKYTLVDMSKEELVVAINSQLEWATTSLDERMLGFKDCRSNFSKTLIQLTVKICGIKHGTRGVSGLVEEDKPEEIWLDDDPGKAVDFLKYEEEFMTTAPKTVIEYFKKRGLLTSDLKFVTTRPLSGLYELRRLYIFLNVSTQHGLFVKNPVILTLAKSILPRASISLAPRVGSYIYNQNTFSSEIPYQLDWSTVPVFKEMFYEGRKLIQAYTEKYNILDLNGEFIKGLTNKSGGVVYKPTAAETADIPEEILRVFGKKRLIYYILNPLNYESFPYWIDAMKNVTTSGERKQIDRRPRVIQMVSNAAQLAPFLVFLLVDIMGKDEPELGSKKNTGTIRDMSALLRSTTDFDSVQESADISGMDASTTQVAVSFINDITIELLNGCKDQRNYFFSRRQNWDVITVDKDGGRTKTTKEIHPGIPVIQISEAETSLHNFRLSIPELSIYGNKVILDTSPHVFPSGKFSTNAQHSLLNTLIMRVLKNTLAVEMAKKRVPWFDLQAKVSGDDIFISFQCRKRDQTINRQFSSELVKIFSTVGFKIGSLLSRYGATFLQQSSIFGTVLPKPDRISITTSERGDSLKLSTFDAFAEERDIIKELCGRVHFPSNTRGLLFLIANQLRRVRIDISNLSEEKVLEARILAMKLRVRDTKFCIDNDLRVNDSVPYRLIVGKTYMHVMLPLISLFVSDGFDLPINSSFFKHYVPASNVFSPRGSIGDWKVRQILKPDSLLIPEFVPSADLRSKLDLGGGLAYDRTKLIEILRQNRAVLDGEIFQYIAGLYDDDLARFLGLDWLTHFINFNVKDVLARMRLAKFPRHVRDEWADRLTSRLNVAAITRSRLAAIQLERAGFRINPRLAFYNTPKERITQAITSGGDSAVEFRVHRIELGYHMLSFNMVTKWLKTLAQETLLLPQFTTDSVHEIPVERDTVIDIVGGLMLSSGVDRDRDFILHKFGHNFYDTSITFSGYYGLSPGPFKDYKHEELVQFASQVYNEHPSLLPLVWEFANIHPRYRAELEQIIRSGQSSEINDWKSIIHTRQCFELSHSLKSIPRLWNPVVVHDGRVTSILNVIMRDLAYSENSILFNQSVLRVPYALLLIHGRTELKLRSLLSISK